MLEEEEIVIIKKEDMILENISQAPRNLRFGECEPIPLNSVCYHLETEALDTIR